MKKYLFIAMAAAGLFSSCSSDDIVGNGNANESNLVPIRLGMGQIVTGTRGTGTVGGLTPETNVWQGQKVNVYMFNKGTMDLAEFKYIIDGTEYKELIYNNAEFECPDENGDSVVAKPTDHSIKYYPTQGAYDFWGYRLDGAETAEPVSDEDSIYVNFMIDGSQDVMVAKAIPTEGEISKVGDENRIYSAYAARRGVQPVLNFKHLLTRLTFEVQAAQEDATNPEAPVVVDAINVKSKNEGKLVVAITGDKEQHIVWNEMAADEYPALFLKQRKAKVGDENIASEDLEPLTPVSLADIKDWENEKLPIGEALLVAPGETEYELTIALHQEKKSNLEGEQKEINYTYTTKIVLPENATFEAGTSYKIIVKLYGLNEIQISTVLTQWTDGGEFVLTPEDDTFED